MLIKPRADGVPHLGRDRLNPSDAAPPVDALVQDELLQPKNTNLLTKLQKSKRCHPKFRLASGILMRFLNFS